MSLTQDILEFPFVRGRWYTLKDLTAFEKALLLARRQNAQLDHGLRLAQQRWMKLRNEELNPLLCFAKQIHLADNTQFRICDEGADADIELKREEGERRLQVTLAGPIWTPTNPNWGYEHKFHVEKLNSDGQSAGWGPIRKEPDGSISNREDMLSTDERNQVYSDGLDKAIKGKQYYRIPDCDLIIHAVAYCEAMDHQTFVNLANAAISKRPLSNFRNIYILDDGEGYLVEYAPQAPCT
ncbi:MAG: hypothetical protein ACLQHK_04715 [Gallionellaceae bacterium]